MVFRKISQAPKHFLGNPQLLPYSTFPTFSSEPSTSSETLAPNPQWRALCSVIPLLVKKSHRTHSTTRTSLKLQRSAHACTHNRETWRQSNLWTEITDRPEDAASLSAAPAFCTSAQMPGNSHMTPQCCDNCWLDQIFITRHPKYIQHLEASSQRG